MIRDWDLWPYRVAAGAPDAMSLPLMVLTRNLTRVQQAIGLALYPTVRNAARRMEAILA